MRLIVPHSNKSSKLLSPFSDEHSRLSLHEASIFEGKSIRMMGVSEDEVDEVIKNAKANLRIAGFNEEEKRMRQRMMNKRHASLKLPQGTYIFCDFRTLQIPGIELNPPPSEALKRMHKLAADPGIVAIMNKHRWRVGVMTEMAPEGYVGVSPKCILGFNKNHGEEISLRLRTDDLKGFRKYESIKKTLLHELAHMVYSEHDKDFYALDKQLNQEVDSLDWTRSRSHSLSGVGHSESYEEEYYVENSSNFPQKLGGKRPDQLVSARASSVVAAYQRLANASTSSSTASEVHEETDPADMHEEPDHMDSERHENLNNENQTRSGSQNEFEPDPDASGTKHCSETDGSTITSKANLDDFEMTEITPPTESETMGNQTQINKSYEEPDPDVFDSNGVVHTKPGPNDNSLGFSRMHTDEPDLEDQLQRIQDPVTQFCSRLQKAIEMLRSEANPTEATKVLETLFKIIRNVIEHPNEMKFKRLRKANPAFQRNVASYKAAMEVLFLIGFNEDVVSDEIGKAETYLVLKRNDPGLLWLAKSSLETCIAY